MNKITLLLTIFFATGLQSSRSQDTLVRTDLSWIYSNDEEPGWQQFNFDDSDWELVVNLGSSCSPVCAIGGDHYGNIYQLPYSAYLREKFYVGNVIGPLYMNNGEDDDVEIYINGNLAFIDDNHLAGEYFNLDVTSFIILNDTNIISVKHTDWYCCGYGMGLLIYGETSSSSVTNDNQICEKFCADFSDPSTNNPTSWQWFFPGGIPSSSTEQNPANICYYDPGTYDVMLITSNANGSDTLTLEDYMQINATPPIPEITSSGNTLTSSTADFYQWQFNTVDIPGATNQSSEATQTGYYSVITSDVNGCVNSATLYVVINGIENIFSDQHISVFPNPNDGKFVLDITLNAQLNADARIEVLNLLGQIIISEKGKIEKGKLVKEIKLSAAATEGVYLVKVTIDNKIYKTQLNYIPK